MYRAEESGRMREEREHTCGLARRDHNRVAMVATGYEKAPTRCIVSSGTDWSATYLCRSLTIVCKVEKAQEQTTM